MNRSLRTVCAFALLFALSSFAHGASFNDCNIKLIKNSLIKKLESISDYKTNIFVKFEGLNIESKITGKKPAKMKIQQNIKTPDYNLNYTAVFDGKYQWVESRRDTYVQVVKLNISKLTNQQRPFDTGYYLMGTGLLNGEDYIGTVTNLLNFYDLDSTCNKNTITLSGMINAKKFRNYALNIKKNKSSSEYIKKYIKKFGYLSIEINKKKLIVNNYKFGQNDKNILFVATFSNTDFNIDLDDEIFIYNPPSGIKVTDITSEVKNNL